METRSDLIIQGLWYRQTKAIIDVKISDYDLHIYRFDTMVKFLDKWEKIKKYKHGNHCHYQQKHFSMFIISVDGMLGRESLVLLANLSRLMAVKMDESILHVQG